MEVPAPIQTFIHAVSVQYTIDEDDLTALWKTTNPIDYSTFKLHTLQEMCRSKGLKVTGTKKDLVERLKNPPAVQSKEAQTKKQKKGVVKVESTSIIHKLMSQTTRQVKRNAFDQYVDEETQYVFNELSMSVTGHRQPDGTVTELTPSQMRDCWERGFSFRVPNTHGLSGRTESCFVDRYTGNIAVEEHPTVPIAKLGIEYPAFWEEDGME